MATISTVGYGEVVPATAAGRIFTMIQVFVGIGVFVTTAASIVEHVISTDKAERKNWQRQD